MASQARHELVAPQETNGCLIADRNSTQRRNAAKPHPKPDIAAKERREHKDFDPDGHRAAEPQPKRKWPRKNAESAKVLTADFTDNADFTEGDENQAVTESLGQNYGGAASENLRRLRKL